MFAGNHLFGGDTPIPALNPKRGRTKTGQLRVYPREQRPWGGPDGPAAIYLFAPDREAARLYSLLAPPPSSRARRASMVSHSWMLLRQCPEPELRPQRGSGRQHVSSLVDVGRLRDDFLATIVGGHALWFEATHDPVIGMRLGAAITGLGIVVTARPFFRTGLRDTVNSRLPGRLSAHSSIERLQQQAVEHVIASLRDCARCCRRENCWRRHRTFRPFLNGYGDLPLRWMGYAAE